MNDRTDYTLWEIRVEAACSAKILYDVLQTEDFKGPVAEGPNFVHRKRQASNRIISALADQSLRVVRAVTGSPFLMMAELDIRYDSNSMAKMISRMSELASVKDSNPNADIARQIDHMQAPIEQPRSMKASILESYAIGILLLCIEVHHLLPITAGIKKRSEEQVPWEAGSERRIDECEDSKTDVRDHSEGSSKGCPICKLMHEIEDYWLNRVNPNSRLGIPKKRTWNKN